MTATPDVASPPVIAPQAALKRGLPRLPCDPRSKAYVKKRTGGTKANLDILRRLKRYTARELYPLIVEALTEAEPDLVPAA